MCFMRICDYKFAAYGFFAEHKEVALWEAGTLQRLPASPTMGATESPANRVGPITLDWKLAGKPIAGNRHDGFEEAGAGTQLTVRLLRHSQRKRGATDRRNLRSMALALDPTRPSQDCGDQ